MPSPPDPATGAGAAASSFPQRTPQQIKDLVREIAAGTQALLGERREVLEPLALGGMAVILQLRHRAHGGLFVAKVLRPEFAHRPEILEAFRDEARHASLLTGHPCAVGVFDLIEGANLCLMTMPYIDGEDLDQLLARHGPLGEDETLKLAGQVAGLLCHAESFGITHGDLAPGNIRLDVFGQYRVLDLGISHARDSGKAYQPLGGTPRYSSPEQLEGETPDARSDIYALGLILVETLTGQPVFKSESPGQLRTEHLRGVKALPGPIEDNAQLARLLRRMLARERKDRFQSCLDLCTALSAFIQELPEAGRPGAAAGGATTPRRPRLSAFDPGPAPPISL